MLNRPLRTGGWEKIAVAWLLVGPLKIRTDKLQDKTSAKIHLKGSVLGILKYKKMSMSSQKLSNS